MNSQILYTVLSPPGIRSTLMSIHMVFMASWELISRGGACCTDAQGLFLVRLTRPLASGLGSL